MASQKSTSRPVHEVRLGRIRAAIWCNDTRSGTRYNVTLSRLYRDDDGNWRDSTSFGRDDLLLAGKVLDLAHTWICQAEAEGANAQREPEPAEATF